METVSCKKIGITDGFWKEKQTMISDVTLQSVYNRFKETHRFDALDCAWKEGEPNQPHVFWDSDVAKWIEGLAYTLYYRKNAELEKIADEAIEKIIKNRDENGYFNSHFLVTGKKFTERNEHELYCAGHLTEAAVAYYEATGKREFLDAMCKYMDYIEKVFLKDKSAAFVTPGHPEIELALVKLYKVTGEKRYLELSKFFVDAHGNNNVDKNLYNGCNLLYNQDEVPLRERETADGHCVRALYLFSAMADLAYIYNDKELFDAAERCFMNIIDKRMYITGATGSTHHGESFTVDYHLPNRTAYAETCASIALGYFANRMIKLNPDGKYADTVERVMYNGVLAGISTDGKGFFYENPLEIDVGFNDVNKCTDGGDRYPITQRKEVFDCSCCPPNVIRFISSIADFMYSYTEDTLFVHQYINSDAEFEGITVKQITNYPADEEIIVKIQNNSKKYVALRIPSWCKDFEINKDFQIKAGYAYISSGETEEIRLKLEMPVTFISANKKVHANAGRVAVMRGPIVYCLEGVDNGEDLNSLRVDIKEKGILTKGEFSVPDIILKAYKEPENNSLYFEATQDYEETQIKLIPYFAYANRVETDMLVWILKK